MMARKVFGYLKQETVLTVAAILAVGSMALIPPDMQYLDYLDFKVLVLLFSMMIVVAGFRKIGLFAFMGIWMTGKAKSGRSLEMILVFLCFFTSMLITNDVALLTFVPFSISLLQMTGRENRMIPVIVFQTIAANLGSMLTPIGNPQNLYLYSVTEMGIGEFLKTMLPLTAASFLLLLLVLMTGERREILSGKPVGKPTFVFERIGWFYTMLFILSVMTVIKILPYQLLFLIVAVSVMCLDRSAWMEPDYALLITFVCFFVFIGNMQRLERVQYFLKRMIAGRELVTAIAASQVISNVPAAVLLSGFTDQVKVLLYGTNIGGLGTLIASMASLISYKFYARIPGASTGTYLLCFTKWNVLFLALLTVMAMLLLG